VSGTAGIPVVHGGEDVKLLNAGLLDLDFLVTHWFPLADWAAALAALRDPDPAAPRGKVMLKLPS
jgi:threonine dehydrogenase-like Zn-dependent dehydrogenase